MTEAIIEEEAFEPTGNTLPLGVCLQIGRPSEVSYSCQGHKTRHIGEVTWVLKPNALNRGFALHSHSGSKQELQAMQYGHCTRLYALSYSKGRTCLPENAYECIL